MCGRFTLTSSGEALARYLALPEVPELRPRYNIAPGQEVAVVVEAEGAERRLEQRRWGLVPRWAKDVRIGSRLINARSETVAEKPAFRSAFRRRRCLVPADGFFEWQRRRGVKQPFHVRVREGEPFGIAGLWERWQPEEGDALESCALLTTEANEIMRPVHDRMPVILDARDFDRWLSPGGSEPARLLALLRPCPDDWLTLVPVSRRVNDPRNDDPSCIEPLFDEEVPPDS